MARTFVNAALACFVLAATPAVFAQATQPGITRGAAGGKELLIPPRGVSRVPADNDYNNPASEFSFKHSKSSDNFVLFWAKEYGDDPMANPTANLRFNADEVLKECDRFYDYYVNTLKWVDKDKSLATKYKFLIYVIGGSGGTAFGGSIDDKVGAFWSPATRINRGPYGVVAHELGHSFQALLRADGFTTPGGPSIAEMTSQYMLWQVYPEWQTFENYHLTAFMQATHLAFLHPDNQYHTCYPLEYWSEKHGADFIGKLWRSGARGEDTVQVYKRITNLTQEQFNDEMFDACRRFVTWDMPRIEKVAAKYQNQHVTSMKAMDGGWYQIDESKCPQNYGYNAIKLKVPAAGTKVDLTFKGIAGAEGFRSVQVEKAGWRYGFLASKEDGSRTYGEVYSKSQGAGQFVVPTGTKYLWLVVMGAPTEYFQRPGGRGRGGPATATAPRGGAATATAATGPGRGAGAGGRGAGRGAAAAPPQDEQWPYQIMLTGTEVDEAMVVKAAAK